MTKKNYSRMNHPRRKIKYSSRKGSQVIAYRGNTKEVHCDECNGKAIMKLFKVKCLECGVEVVIK